MQGPKSALSDSGDHVLSQDVALPPREGKGSDAMGRDGTLSTNEQTYLRHSLQALKGASGEERRTAFRRGGCSCRPSGAGREQAGAGYSEDGERKCGVRAGTCRRLPRTQTGRLRRAGRV